MGEIEEALRRARQERTAEGREDQRAPAPARPRPPVPDVYSTSAALHERERASDAEADPTAPSIERAPSPPAPPPKAKERGDGGTLDNSDDPGVELTHAGAQSRAPQGVIVDDGGAVTDACLQLALRVRKALADRDARTLAVVSAFRNEGKTTVSCNLALALASLGEVQRVALVDLDLRRPSVETVLELATPTIGIDQVLAGRQPLEAARVRVASPRMDVYPCLRGQPKAHELLLSSRFEQMVSRLRDRYDVVIFDSPPSLLVPDATIIMQHVDCFAPVARAGMTRSRNFKKMLDMLPRKRMLGGILDGGAMSVRKSYYDHYAPDPEPESEAAHGA